MQEVDSLVQLGQYGIIGVMLALIGLCAFVMWLYYKITTKHIEKSGVVFQKVIETLTKNLEVTSRLDSTVSKLEETVRNKL